MHQLRSRYLNSLHALFGAHAPSLAASFPQLPLESIEKSLPATKLGFDSRELEKEFDKWQRERTSDARKAFDEMLSENAFVEFWGRLGKIGGEGVDGGVAAEELGEDEGEGFGGKVDMKVLAKNVDLEDIINVLKVRVTNLYRLDLRVIPRTTRGISYLSMCQTRGKGGFECVISRLYRRFLAHELCHSTTWPVCLHRSYLSMSDRFVVYKFCYVIRVGHMTKKSKSRDSMTRQSLASF